MKHRSTTSREDGSQVFRRLVTAVSQHRRLVAVCATAGMIAGVAFFLRESILYEAKSRLIFDPESPLIQTYTERYLYEWGVFRSLTTHLESLRSEGILTEAAQSMGGGVTPDRIRERLDISIDENDIIDVSFSDPDPDIARAVPNAVCRTFLRHRADDDAARRARAMSAVEHAIGKIRTELSQKDSVFRDFRERNFPADLERQREILLRAELNTETDLHSSEIELEETRSRLAEVRTRAGKEKVLVTETIEGEDQLAKQIDEITVKIADLSGKYGAEHPVMKSLRKQLEQLDRLSADGHRISTVRQIVSSNPLREQLSSAASELEARTPALEARIGTQKEMLQELSKELDNLPRLEKVYLQLAREREALDETLRYLEARRERLKVNELVTESDVKILEAAAVFRRVKAQGRFWIPVLWLFWGLAAGIALAYTLERLDPTIKDIDNLERRLGLPILGLTEHLEAEKILIGSMVDPHKPASESLNSLRSHVKQLCRAGKIKVLMIASPLSGEGKTMISSAMALNYARDGRRTLLIDADLRRSRISHLFGVNSAPGLKQFLEGAAEPEEIVRQSHMSNLSVVGSGGVCDLATELLGSLRLGVLMARFRREYDLILIDSPALLQVSDATALARHVDSSLLVVRWRSTPMKAAQAARTRLLQLGCPVSGMIANDVARGWDYRAYYGYSDEDEKRDGDKLSQKSGWAMWRKSA